MNYYIIEIQVTAEGTSLLHEIKNNYNQALSTFFDKCKYAAVSGLPRHTIVLLNEGGTELKCETFTTETEYE